MSKKGKHINPAQSQPDKAYFDSLTDKIMERVELEESILYTDERLKVLPFKTPEGYFDQLGAKILKSNKQETKVIPLFSQTWVRYAAAAAVLMVMVAAFVLNTPLSTTSTQEYLSNIPEETLIDYVVTDDAAIEELFINEEVMEAVIENMMADIAYKYEDLIDFEKDGFYLDNY